MNMDEYFVLFREYMLVQKPSSVNTRDSYLRDVSAFLHYLEGENITSPLEVETETVEAYVQHLHSLNRTNSTISRNIASVRCFYKFLILRGDMQVNPPKIRSDTLKPNQCRKRRAKREALQDYRSGNHKHT